MEWTTENRLNLIREVAAAEYEGIDACQTREALRRIMFLCDMPSEFLEQNKINYEDAIASVARGGKLVEV